MNFISFICSQEEDGIALVYFEMIFILFLPHPLSPSPSLSNYYFIPKVSCKLIRQKVSVTNSIERHYHLMLTLDLLYSRSCHGGGE